MTEQDWIQMTSTGTFYLETDWIGVDKNGHVGVFTAIMSAAVPSVVKTSFKQYVNLKNIISQLPQICDARLSDRKNESDDDWLDYSEKGLYVYDFSDVYRKGQNSQYYLISTPTAPITIGSLNLKPELLELIPRFNCYFSEGNVSCDLIVE